MENNKETLNRDAFKQIVKEIVKEEIDKGNLDESFIGNIGRGIKGAFASNSKSSAQYAPKTGMNNLKARVQSMKAGFKTGQNIDKIDVAIKALEDLLKNKDIVGNIGNKTNNAIQKTLSLLKMSSKRQNATASAYRNAI